MSNKVDFTFISALEGGQKLQGYVPAASTSQSGVTIATGFDLGARDKTDLQRLLLAPTLIAKLEPYLGKKTFAATSLIAEKPLVITKQEADAIDVASHQAAVKTVSTAYNQAITARPELIRFEQLPGEAQTVIASVAFQYGNLPTRTPSFWKLVTSQSWNKTITELRNFGDRYATRRNKEADLLSKMLTTTAGKPTVVTGVVKGPDHQSAGASPGGLFTAFSTAMAELFGGGGGAEAPKKISAGVGKGGKNQADDVKIVQKLLNQHLLPPRRLLDVNGVVDNYMITVIMEFQRQTGGFKNPDGLVEPSGRTFQLLQEKSKSGSNGAGAGANAGKPASGTSNGAGANAGNGAGAAGSSSISTSGSPFFPFPEVTKYSWETGARAFGTNRSGGARAHGGCDLYYPKGTWIHAVADGVVVRGPYDFYSQTYALEVDHGSFLLRYGEIMAGAPVKTGDKVKAGQRIAQVGHLVGITVASDMLHLEMYSKAAAGSLTVGAAAGAKRKDGVPFHRRSDLLDPTPFLNQWRNNLPKV